MKKNWLVFAIAMIAFLGFGIASVPAYDNNAIHTVREKTYRNTTDGQVYADNNTDAYLVSPAYGPDSSDPYRPDVIFFRGAIVVRSTGNSIVVQAFKDEATAIVRVRGLVKISEGWNGLEIKPLQGEAELISPSYVSASAWNKTLIRISLYGRVSHETYYWNNYSSFENWCLTGGYNNQYDDRAIEDRGYDEYGNYVVVRTYDPDIRVYYSITHYYISNPWWWYRAEYGRFEYVYGYGWVFIPYPNYWQRHCYYYEAPATGRYHYGIIVKEREETSRPQIPKEKIAPYRPKETPESPNRSDPGKYKIRRIEEGRPNQSNRNPTGNSDGNQVIPREPSEPVQPQKPGNNEPKRSEPDGYTPREPREPQNGDAPQVREPQRKEPEKREPQSPPDGNGQVKPKESQDGDNQAKPPDKPPEKEPVKKPVVKKPPKKIPDPPKKEKT